MRVILTILLSFFYASPVYAGSYVSEMQGIFLPSESTTVDPGQIDYILLPNLGANNSYEVSLNVTGIKKDVIVGICSEQELRNIIARSFTRCKMRQYQGRFLVRGKSNNATPHYLVIDNRRAMFLSKTAQINTFTTFELPKETRQELQSDLELASTQIQEMFLVKKFDINFISCKMANAFSSIGSGDITLCSELLFDVIQKHNIEAFIGIMAHEMGHTFMQLWGSPHASNEKSADEMAVALIFIMDKIDPITKGKTKPEIDISPEKIIRGFIEYFDNGDNLLNEVQAAHLGDQHQLSVQRVNNIRAIMMSPAPFVKRWTKEIYPHLTVHSLNEIIKEPHIGADVTLARKILLEREQKNVAR